MLNKAQYREQVQALGEKAREKFEQDLTIERLGQTIEQVLEKVRAEKPTRSSFITGDSTREVVSSQQ